MNTFNKLQELKLVKSSERRLLSGIKTLDALIGGGLREGELSEWGMPWGQGLREFILPFLSRAQADYSYWILWVYGRQHVAINPWAWHARSIDLDTMRFVSSQDPLQDLKHVFLSDFFRVIVLDQAPHLKEEDCQHLARNARTYGQSILILRPHLLTHEQGNLWTRTRLNCVYDFEKTQTRIEVIKGAPPKTITLSPHDLASSLYKPLSL
ncbi:MAG: hypothetical protein H7249_04005 [Chitinophagaceae bacterium]|nr:hypothetical protein [Oligoflexus sp.]